MAGKKGFPFKKNDKDNDKDGKKKPFGGKRAELFNGRRPPKRGK